MPSFTFFCSRDRNEINALRSDSTCIVPDGFEGKKGEANSAHSHLKWNCAAHAPVDHHQPNEHGFAFLIGEAIAENSDDYLTASELYSMVAEHTDQAAKKLSRYSGFFAWLVVLDDETVYCGSDPFGFFPVYYFQGKQSIGIATSLNALHAHTEYDQSIDPIGFCRYLLENGCSSHRTLEESGKRLDIAQSIRYDSTSSKLLTTQHPYPGQDAQKIVHNIDEAIQLAAEATRKAVMRHTQRSVDSCMLSGGLDSRQVLGIAHELGHRPKCVTTGDYESYECINARRITRKLKLPWSYASHHTEPPQRLLNNDIYLSALGGGFNSTPMSWCRTEALRGTRYLTGLYLDVTYGPGDHVSQDPTFGSYAYAQNSWIHTYGVIPDSFSELLSSQQFKEGLQSALSESRAEWETLSPDPFEREWFTSSRYRARAHHGGISWKNAFYNWPLIPALDVPLTETIRSIDGELLDGRRLQKETFKAMLPELAKIPFASVSAKPQPLIPTIFSRYHRRIEKLQRRIWRLKKKYSKTKVDTQETFESSWVVADAQALDQLEQATGVFDIDKVRALISGVNCQSKPSYRDQYNTRLLVAGILWLASRKPKQ